MMSPLSHRRRLSPPPPRLMFIIAHVAARAYARAVSAQQQLRCARGAAQARYRDMVPFRLLARRCRCRCRDAAAVAAEFCSLYESSIYLITDIFAG